MTNDFSTSYEAIPSENTTAEAIHAASRFLRVLQYRKWYLIGAMVVSALFATIYFFTTKFTYEATSSLLITQNTHVWNASTTQDGNQQALIPTYEQLFHSNIVLNGAVQKVLQLPEFAHVDFLSVPPDRWIDVLSENLVAKATRQTNIIKLVYRSNEAAAAKAVLSAVVDSYLEFIEKNHKDNSVQIVKILEKERKEIQTALEQKKSHLLEMKRSAREFGLREDGTILHPTVQRVVRINETLIDVQKERLQSQATLSSVREAVRQGRDLRQHFSRIEPGLGAQLLANTLGLNPQSIQLLNDIEQKMITDQAKLVAWRMHFGPTHPEIIQLEESIARAQQYRNEYLEYSDHHSNSLQNDRLGVLLVSMLEERLLETKRHEKDLLRQYAALESEAVKLNDRLFALQMVEHDVERLNKHHDALLDNITNLDIGQNRSDLRVAVVSDPTLPSAPVSPRLAFVALIASLGGFGLGIVLVYVVDILDDRFRSPDEMTDQMGIPLLAVVRDMPANDSQGIDSIQTYVSPDDSASEAFRTLRTTLAFSDDDTTCLAITSSQPGDGKTTIVSNLATTFALAGKRTLLIDADLRRPGLTRLLDKRGPGGLSVVLRSTGEITKSCQDLILPTGIDGLDLLACGPRPSDPAELLASSRMGDVIGWAESVYDQVLIDCPPIMAAPDAAIVGKVTHGVVLVVQPEKNHRRLVLRATENIRSLNVKMLGVVANRIANSKTGYYGHDYSYTYGYEDEDKTVEDQSSELSQNLPGSTTDLPLHDESTCPKDVPRDDTPRSPIKPRRAA